MLEKALKIVLKILIGSASMCVLAILSLYILFVEPNLWSFWKPVEYSLNGVECHKIKDIFQYFYEDSEFRLPADTKVILHCDDHSGFHGDGEYYAVFDVENKENTDSFLNHKPWGTSWKKGLVPKEVKKTALSKEFPEVFSSSEVWYLLDTTPKFYNFRLMIADPLSNRIFYSKWDS